MASSSEFPAAGPAGNPPVALSHHTPGKQSFTLLHDKNMLAPASASSWCPTMDLLALATTDGQLSLSRLEWNKQGGERENKLWSTNPDAPVTSLGWRPDGKVLVSGHADGTVVLHHVEDGETLHVSKPHARAVTSLHWQIAPASDAARSALRAATTSAAFRGPAAIWPEDGPAATPPGAPALPRPSLPPVHCRICLQRLPCSCPDGGVPATSAESLPDGPP